MKMLTQILVLFTICLAGSGLSALAPFPFPASVAAMLILFVLLLLKALRPVQLSELTNFLLKNMAVLFIPATVGIMEIYEEIRPHLFALVFICMVTTVLTFAVTAWTVTGVVRLQERLRGGPRNG